MDTEAQKLHGAERSPHWHTVSHHFLQRHTGGCAGCGAQEKLQVHHIKPFHLFPELELVESNWIVLCEGGAGEANCHLHLGHHGNFKLYNLDVVADAAANLAKVQKAMKEQLGGDAGPAQPAA